MRYRKLSTSGDYQFGAGQKDFYRDVPEAVGQAVQTRILLWIGEWFLDTSVGTPFMQGILGKHSKETADTTLRDRILGTQGIVDISDYESEVNPDTRVMTVVKAEINTIYGPTSIDLSNYVNF